MSIELTENAQNQLKDRKVSIFDINNQIERFKKGFSFSNLIKPCTFGDGIKKFSSEELDLYIKLYDKSLSNLTVSKFVPASGAASRMFKDLVNLQESLNTDSENYNKEVLNKLASNIENFAFYSDLDAKLAKKLDDFIDSGNFGEVLNALLDETGLNYKKLPKGLIKFHDYFEESRTAFEEHLIEGIEYLNSDNKFIHFTIQEEFLNLIKDKINTFKSSDKCKDFDFDISYSSQNPSTDTIAVDMENNPIATEDGNLVFRPAGHGALISNLNSIQQDIIFIKNIDNVVKEDLIKETVEYKKALGGYLVEIQKKIFEFLKLLSGSENKEINYEELIEFCESKLFIAIDNELSSEEKHSILYSIFNRPIRVCGVVKNEGEPGGGPFWVEDSYNNISMQIVESAQVDLNSKDQSKIWGKSTHFNPVDIVCGVYDYKGNKFNLDEFIDYEAGIITKKSFNGKDIKALELPGLWNGSMANWNTVFVEVPLSTFNPVKTVFDLLRDKHQ